MTVTLIYASSPSGLIATADGSLPWIVPEDLRMFRERTLGNTIIMGRATWDSFGARKLPGRQNIVISRAGAQGIRGTPDLVISSIARLRAHIQKFPSEQYFIIGGAELFDSVISFGIDRILISRIEEKIPKSNETNGVFFFNSAKFSLFGWSPREKFTLLSYEPSVEEHFEFEYLNLVKKVLCCGQEQPDRTGTGTLSIFGHQMKFDMKESFPLLTTKKMSWKSVQEELFFFLAGKTNTRELEEKGVGIWRAHTSKEFLEARGLDYKEGEMGPMYGAQWRNYGGAGIDQLMNIVNEIKKNPFSRRLVMSTLNINDVEKGVLWPCHGLVLQFFCRQSADGRYHLSALMYQRSADIFLGLPFNIASYALLLHLVANYVEMIPETLTIQIGNAHIYKNHLEQARTQLSRAPLIAPKLEIVRKVTDWSNLSQDYVNLVGYFHHPQIRGSVAI